MEKAHEGTPNTYHLSIILHSFRGHTGGIAVHDAFFGRELPILSEKEGFLAIQQALPCAMIYDKI